MVDKAIKLLKMLKKDIENNKPLSPFPYRNLIHSIFLNSDRTLKDEFITIFPIEKADEFYRAISIMGTANTSSGFPPNDEVGSMYCGRLSRKNLLKVINEIINEMDKKDDKEKMKDIMIDKIENYDIFISHASEDKDALARPLAKKLLKLGYNVFLDEFVIKLGDRITQSINEGLSQSKYCVLIISPTFLEKNWTRAELDSITNMYIGSNKKILPIWHNITYDDVRNKAPLLIDLRAVDSSKGVDFLVEEIQKSIGNPSNSQSLKTNYIWNFYDFSEEVQIGILKNLVKILTDVELEFYHDALEQGMIYLETIRNHKLIDTVKQEVEKTYEQFKNLLFEDEIDLQNDR